MSSSTAGAPLRLHPACGHGRPPGGLAVVLLIKWRRAEAWLQTPSEYELKDTRRIIGLQSDVITSVPPLLILCTHRESGRRPSERVEVSRIKEDLSKESWGLRFLRISVYTKAQRRRICARPRGGILRGFPSKSPNDGSLDITNTWTYRLTDWRIRKHWRSIPRWAQEQERHVGISQGTQRKTNNYFLSYNC